MNLFLLLIAAHLCGDVLSYSRFLATLKRQDEISARIKGIALHCLIHGFFVLLWLWSVSWDLRFLAALYVYGTHFIIDFVRVPMERALIDKREFKILKRSDTLCYFLGKGDPQTRVFMKKYLGKWTLVNGIDQSLHVLAIAVFVFVLQ